MRDAGLRQSFESEDILRMHRPVRSMRSLHIASVDQQHRSPAASAQYTRCRGYEMELG